MKTKQLSEQQLSVLNENYPVSTDENRQSFPRFGMLSKDITEETGKGKTKKIDVIEVAGTFYTEKDKGETNEDGKSVWTREYLEGETADVIVAFHRYQLRRFDSSLNKFYSTPVYDTPDQVLPLYLDKQIVMKGTEKELQSKYPKLTQKGKPSSDLGKNTILFVLYKDELYQLNLSVSSGWAFSAYKRSINPSTVVTTLGSTEETFGTNTYRKMSFTKGRSIDVNEFEQVSENQTTLKTTVENDSKLYLGTGEIEADKNFKNF
jgi:hypothetical protein